MNKVIVSGNVMKGFQVKEINGKNGKYKMALFTVLTTEKPRTFVPCIAWSGMADFFDKYMSEEGKPIEVIGKWASSMWEKDGQKMRDNKCQVIEFNFAPAPYKSENASTGASDGGFMSIPDDIADEIPFA